MASIEEKVEEYYKTLLDHLGIRHFGKTEHINDSITRALRNADSKSGGSGMNFPDIQLLLQNKTRRDIPVMIEAKGTKNKLEKLAKDGTIELVSGGKNPNSAVQQLISSCPILPVCLRYLALTHYFHHSIQCLHTSQRPCCTLRISTQHYLPRSNKY